MAKTFTAPFAQTTKTASAVCTAAVSSLNTDTPSNAVAVYTAGLEGALVTKLTAIPRATTTASALYLFISNDAGSTIRLLDSELMVAHTVEATTAIPEVAFLNISESSPIRLGAGDRLYVGIGVALAAGVVFNVEATEF